MTKRKRLLFQYRLSDAWHRLISVINVFEETNRNNVYATCKIEYLDNHVTLTATKSYTAAIDVDCIRRIREYISQHNDVLQIASVEDNWITDGCINEFSFGLDENTHHIMAGNINYFEKNNFDIHGNYPAKAKTVLDLFHKISNELIQSGVDLCYLQLKPRYNRKIMINRKVSEREREALNEKMEHPENEVVCPRCGRHLMRREIPATIEVFCPSPNCIRASLRGI